MSHHICHHCICSHADLAYCSTCNVVYCKDCKKEWIEKVSYNITWGTDWNYQVTYTTCTHNE